MRLRIERRVNTADGLIIINVLLFLLFQCWMWAGIGTQEMLNNWWCVPQDFAVLTQKPWTLLTYAFYHVGWEHLFWNMLFLFFAGRIFFHLSDTFHFLLSYGCGIIGGALTFVSIAYWLPALESHTILLGASAGVVAILAYVVAVRPSYNVYIFTYRVKLIYLMLALVLFDIVDIQINTGGKLAHFGGIISGLCVGLLVRYLKLIRPQKTIFSQENKETSNQTQKIKQHYVNQLLEKINVSGYTSLTEKEKKFLFDVSKDQGNS